MNDKENLADHGSVAARIKFLMQQKRMSQAQFARKLGIDPANMSKHLNGHLPITSGLINRIAVDMGVSKRWLTTGDDLPFAKDCASTALTASGPRRIPIYDIDVTAGCAELSRQFTDDRIIGSIHLPQVSPDSVMVRVNGDSMEPEIHDGSFVAIRTVSDLGTIFWGQIYVVVLDDYRMVKFVRRHSDPRYVVLHSANASYDDMEIERDKIRRLYMVEMVLNVKLRC